MWSNETFESSDPEEFVALFRPGDCKLVVTERGHFAARTTLIDMGRFQCRRRRERLSRVAEFDVHRPAMIFHTTPGPEMVLNGVEIRYGDIAICRPGERYLSRLSGPTSWGTVKFTDDDLTALSPVSQICHSAGKSGVRVITPPVDKLARLRWLHAAAGELEETSEEKYTWELEKALAALLVDTIGMRMQPDTIRRQHHHQVVRRFFRFAEAQSIEPVNMQVVSDSIGVSGRTLRAACQEMLGVSPTQYLLLRRMGMVRCALQQGDSKTTRVTDVATMFGFWELGRFSVRYRQIFGESPSTTLRH